MLVLDTVENRRRVKCHAFDRVENTDPGVLVGVQTAYLTGGAQALSACYERGCNNEPGDGLEGTSTVSISKNRLNLVPGQILSEGVVRMVQSDPRQGKQNWAKDTSRT